MQDFPDAHHALQLLFGKVSPVRNTSNQAQDLPDAPAARPPHVPSMRAPNMLGRRFTVMMMPGRIPDHVYGGTAFLASPTVPSPPQSRGFSLPRGEAPKGKVSCLPSKEGEKNFHLEELKTVSYQKLCVAAGWRHCKCPQPEPFHPVSARAECPPASEHNE